MELNYRDLPNFWRILRWHVEPNQWVWQKSGLYSRWNWCAMTNHTGHLPPAPPFLSAFAGTRREDQLTLKHTDNSRFSRQLINLNKLLIISAANNWGLRSPKLTDMNKPRGQVKSFFFWGLKVTLFLTWN